MSNFGFLSPDWPVLNELGEFAERNIYIDPNTSLIKLRMYAEALAKYLLAYEKIDDPVCRSPSSKNQSPQQQWGNPRPTPTTFPFLAQDRQ